jgi:predicted Zn-ribbon and HTH transcriptional regulator
MREQRTVIPFYALRLGQTVQPLCVVSAECMSCGHKETVDTVALIHRYGPDMGLKELEKKFRCIQCKQNWVQVSSRWL